MTYEAADHSPAKARKLRVEYPGAIYHPLALSEALSATSVMNSEGLREQVAATVSRLPRLKAS